MEEKKITIIMSYYNAQDYLEAAVKSILNQTYRNVELICIDDASTDNSRSIMNSFEDERIVHIVNEENQGCAHCRNQGLLAAKGDYIGFMDADDISHISRLEKESNYLDEHQDVLAITVKYGYINAQGRRIRQGQETAVCEDINIRAFLLFGNCFGNGAALFRREVVDRYHIMANEKLKTSSDFLFWQKCLLCGKMHCLDEILYYYREGDYQSPIKRLVNKNHQADDNIKLSIFRFAWKHRGFCLNKKEIKYIYTYLYKKEQLHKLIDYWKGFHLYRKIKKQANSLGLVEKQEVLTIYKEGMKKQIMDFLKIMD
jgi:Glycosyltransferases involved in cell wall biogenesis